MNGYNLFSEAKLPPWHNIGVTEKLRFRNKPICQKFYVICRNFRKTLYFCFRICCEIFTMLSSIVRR